MVATSSTTAIANEKRRRTKTGCGTCRIRKVKCDETKPICKRCSDTGRKCDGYPPAPTQVVTGQVPRLLCNNIPIFKTTEALSAYSFFVDVSAPGLVNFGSYSFWNRLVLQASFQEMSIKHLIIAVSTLDMQQRAHSKSPQDEPLYVLHYGKALQQLSNAQNPDISVILIACLLFIVCDDMLQNQQSALQHIFAARGILKEYHKQPNAEYHDTVEELGPIFQRLSLQTGELDQQTLPYHTRWPYCQQLKGFTKPSVFEHDYFQARSVFEGYQTIDDASICLRRLAPSCLAPQPPWKAPASRFHVVPNVTAQLNQWLSYFDSMCGKMSAKEATAQRISLHLLRTYHLCLSIMSRCAPFGEESLYDQYMGQLEHVVIKTGFLLTYNSGEIPDMEERVLCPVFFVAAHYRNISVRRTAIGHLRRCGWSGIRLATLAEEIMKLEEQGCKDAIVAADIPENRRIRALGIQFPESIMGRVSSASPCVLTYCISPYESPASVKRHTFNWQDVGDQAVQSSIIQLLDRMLVFEFPSIST